MPLISIVKATPHNIDTFVIISIGQRRVHKRVAAIPENGVKR